MINFLKSLWRKLFLINTRYYSYGEPITEKEWDSHMDILRRKALKKSHAYDPSEDPEKILKGEFESYFD